MLLSTLSLSNQHLRSDNRWLHNVSSNVPTDAFAHARSSGVSGGRELFAFAREARLRTGLACIRLSRALIGTCTAEGPALDEAASDKLKTGTTGTVDLGTDDAAAGAFDFAATAGAFDFAGAAAEEAAAEEAVFEEGIDNAEQQRKQQETEEPEEL